MSCSNKDLELLTAVLFCFCFPNINQSYVSESHLARSSMYSFNFNPNSDLRAYHRYQWECSMIDPFIEYPVLITSLALLNGYHPNTHSPTHCLSSNKRKLPYDPRYLP